MFSFHFSFPIFQNISIISNIIRVIALSNITRVITVVQFFSCWSDCGIDNKIDHDQHVCLSGKKKFTEGWVEFKRKRIAKAVVQSLNGNIIGGKKGSYYHDDIWAMKYLPRFKWSNLTEKLAYDSAVRKKKLQQEMTQVKKETNFFLEQMDKNKQITAIKRKREEKQTSSNPNSTPNSSGDASTGSESSSRAPKQRKLAQQSNNITSSVLANVFTRWKG